MSLVEIFNPADDGYQFVYIDNVLSDVIHCDDGLISYRTTSLLEALGHEVNIFEHCDLTTEQVNELEERGFWLDM